MRLLHYTAEGLSALQELSGLHTLLLRRTHAAVTPRGQSSRVLSVPRGSPARRPTRRLIHQTVTFVKPSGRPLSRAQARFDPGHGMQPIQPGPNFTPNIRMSRPK